jgi:uncharacterized protein YgbK (DUF1537 family)
MSGVPSETSLHAGNGFDPRGSAAPVVGAGTGEPALRSEIFARLPAPWPIDPLPEIQEKVRMSRRTLVVLDDDPTGTQTVHDIPVLTEWTVGALAREFSVRSALFYLLTNSRSLPPAIAEQVNREIATNLIAATSLTGRDFAVVSRSDSTLRGHFPLEMEVLAETLGQRDAPWIVAPYFEAGGRFTIGDVHYVAEGDRLLPAGSTPFARDASFGYRSSNLREWVEEKTGGRIAARAVASISIEELRGQGPEQVYRRLTMLPTGGVCVVNAASPRDMEVFALGLLKAEAGGHKFLYRTAASFVAALAGILPRAPLRSEELATGGNAGGLVVVGSYVAKTSEQLDVLLAEGQVNAIEIEVGSLMADDRRSTEIARLAGVATENLAAGRDVVLYTSRSLVVGTDDLDSLRIGQAISHALVAIVSATTVRPRYLVAKGGITSSDLATKALGVKRAMVAGQILPGIPVWLPGAESRWPGLAYVVFPGNVGERDALLRIVQILGRRHTDVHGAMTRVEAS